MGEILDKANKSKHDSDKCADCQELIRLSEVLAATGNELMATEVLDIYCKAEGGDVIDDIIDTVVALLEEEQEAIKKLPAAGSSTHYGPPPSTLGLPSYWKRFTSFTTEEADTAWKLIQTVDDVPFLRKAVETVYTYMEKRMGDLNEKRGLERDGTIKREVKPVADPFRHVWSGQKDSDSTLPVVAKKPEYMRITRPDGTEERLVPGGGHHVTCWCPPCLQEARAVAMEHTSACSCNSCVKLYLKGGQGAADKAVLKEAKAQKADRFRITHLVNGVIHQWYGEVDDRSCPHCGTLAYGAEIKRVNVMNLNRHGNLRKNAVTE